MIEERNNLRRENLAARREEFVLERQVSDTAHKLLLLFAFLPSLLFFFFFFFKYHSSHFFFLQFLLPSICFSSQYFPAGDSLQSHVNNSLFFAPLFYPLPSVKPQGGSLASESGAGRPYGGLGAGAGAHLLGRLFGLGTAGVASWLERLVAGHHRRQGQSQNSGRKRRRHGTGNPRLTFFCIIK